MFNCKICMINDTKSGGPQFNHWSKRLNMDPLRSSQWHRWCPWFIGLIDPKQHWGCCYWWSPLGESERWKWWARSEASRLSSCWSAVLLRDWPSLPGCSPEKPYWWWARGPGPSVHSAWQQSPQEPCSCLQQQQKTGEEPEEKHDQMELSLRLHRVWVFLNTSWGLPVGLIGNKKKGVYCVYWPGKHIPHSVAVW